jgi:hypothetical protein
MSIKRKHSPVVITDKKRPVAAGVEHLFERLVNAGEKILYDIWSKLKSGLKIRGYVLGRHALQQVDGTAKLI